MAAGFGTTTEEMARAGAQVLAVDEAVQAELAALRGRLGPLPAAWAGAASTQFVALMARWDADARSLSEALGAIGRSIQGTQASYQQQEEQQAGSMSAIRSALG
jgi:early secretory antigenic target protein ESAT-6